MRLDQLPCRNEQGHLHVVVESPRGSQVKLKFDPKLGAFTLSRVLALGINYPYEWGFIPGTHAPDGDPLDAMVLLDVPTFPGVVLACEPIGVLKVEQRKAGSSDRQRNDRIFATSVNAPRLDGLRDIRKLAARAREEIEQFFQTVVALEGKELTLLGWDGPDAAVTLVERASATHQGKGG
jgi:inorganic pyrophosphatase